MIKVLKQMVDALEYWDVHGKLHQPTEEAIQAGKQAITALESQGPAACERCKQLEEHAYDLLGKLKVANIKLSMTKEKTS
jgi:hypothetical protein